MDEYISLRICVTFCHMGCDAVNRRLYDVMSCLELN